MPHPYHSWIQDIHDQLCWPRALWYPVASSCKLPDALDVHACDVRFIGSIDDHLYFQKRTWCHLDDVLTIQIDMKLKWFWGILVIMLYIAYIVWALGPERTQWSQTHQRCFVAIPASPVYFWLWSVKKWLYFYGVKNLRISSKTI